MSDYRKYRNEICQMSTKRLHEELDKELEVDSETGRQGAIEDEINQRAADASDPAVIGAQQHAEDGLS